MYVDYKRDNVRQNACGMYVDYKRDSVYMKVNSYELWRKNKNKIFSSLQLCSNRRSCN